MLEIQDVIEKQVKPEKATIKENTDLCRKPKVSYQTRLNLEKLPCVKKPGFRLKTGMSYQTGLNHEKATIREKTRLASENQEVRGNQVKPEKATIREKTGLCRKSRMS